jgi:hypothetical protein
MAPRARGEAVAVWKRSLPVPDHKPRGGNASAVAHMAGAVWLGDEWVLLFPLPRVVSPTAHRTHCAVVGSMVR